MIAALGLASALLLASAVLARPTDGVPPDVTVDGVPVGGRSADEARRILQRHADERLSQPIRLEDGDVRATVDPVELQAEPRVEQAVRQARDARGPIARIAARLGFSGTVDVPLHWDVPEPRLRQVADDVAEELDREPRDAEVVVRDDEIVIEEGIDGIAVDRDDLVERLAELPSESDVPLERAPPAIGDAAAEDAARRARELLDEPPVLHHDETEFAPQPEQLRRALVFVSEPDEGRIRVRIDPEQMEGPVQEAFVKHEQQVRDAQLLVQGDRVRIRAHRVGRALDLDETLKRLEAAKPGDRIQVAFEETQPDATTSDMRKLRITHEVSQFTTPYDCCPPRVTNIRRAVELLDGTIIGPGERFSLNESMGRRTRERGFVSAPVIANGELVEATGGGVSQVATTMFNAAFFAGMQLVEHTPHQFYISRYPEGREATISWQQLDLVFRNDWDAAVLIKLKAPDSGITIRFFSRPLGRRVETTTSDRFNHRQPSTRTRRNHDLPAGARRVVQDAGQPGFSVTYTRRVYRGDELVRDERFRTDYEPRNRIVEVGTG